MPHFDHAGNWRKLCGQRCAGPQRLVVMGAQITEAGGARCGGTLLCTKKETSSWWRSVTLFCCVREMEPFMLPLKMCSVPSTSGHFVPSKCLLGCATPAHRRFSKLSNVASGPVHMLWSAQRLSCLARTWWWDAFLASLSSRVHTQNIVLLHVLVFGEERGLISLSPIVDAGVHLGIKFWAKRFYNEQQRHKC